MRKEFFVYLCAVLALTHGQSIKGRRLPAQSAPVQQEALPLQQELQPAQEQQRDSEGVLSPEFDDGSRMPFIEPPPAPAPEPASAAQDLDALWGPPQPYSFGYDTQGSGMRQETSDGRKVTGSYTLVGADGINRVVHYVADGDGFRASIITNEPGTEKQNPSGVIMETSQPKAEDLARQFGAQPGTKTAASVVAPIPVLAMPQVANYRSMPTNLQQQIAFQPLRNNVAASSSASASLSPLSQQQQADDDEDQPEDREDSNQAPLAQPLAPVKGVRPLPKSPLKTPVRVAQPTFLRQAPQRLPQLPQATQQFQQQSQEEDDEPQEQAQLLEQPQPTPQPQQVQILRINRPQQPILRLNPLPTPKRTPILQPRPLASGVKTALPSAPVKSPQRVQAATKGRASVRAPTKTSPSLRAATKTALRLPQAPLALPQAPLAIPQAPLVLPQAPLNFQPQELPQLPVQIPQAQVTYASAPVNTISKTAQASNFVAKGSGKTNGRRVLSPFVLRNLQPVQAPLPTTTQAPFVFEQVRETQSPQFFEEQPEQQLQATRFNVQDEQRFQPQVQQQFQAQPLGQQLNNQQSEELNDQQDQFFA